MKARTFDYMRASTLEAAWSAYSQRDGDARYLAGGQSLLAALNLRLDAPSLLIDIAGIADLRGISLDGDMLRIGALARHAEVLESKLVAVHAPLLAAAAPHVAHPAIRNRGTMGGSLALADPAAEFPAVALALDASIEIAGPKSRRNVAANDFFRGLYETALEPGDIVTALRVPVRRAGDFYAFRELARRRGDYALTGLAAHLHRSDSRVRHARLAFFAVGPAPLCAMRAGQALTGRVLDGETLRAAQAALAQDLAPDDDIQMPGTTRLHLATVLLGRVLRDIEAQMAKHDDTKAGEMA